jgi:hypothetical protein
MSAMSPENVEIACPRCKVRIVVPASAGGTSRQCPDCRTDFLITQKMIGLPPAEDFGVAEADDFQIADAPLPAVDDEYDLVSPPPPPLPVAADKSGVKEPEEYEAPAPTWAPTLRPPPGLFTSGLLAFFSSGDLWIRCIPLGFGLFLALWMLGFGLFLGRVGNIGQAALIPWFGCMILCCFGGIIGVLLLMAVSAYAVAVLRDTTDGLDAVEGWPPGFIVDWGQEMLYVGVALLWSLSPGALASFLLPETHPAIIYGVSAAVFFPIALLAALDAVMPMLPISPAVWKSLFRCPAVWLTFFLASIPLFVSIVEMLLLAVNMVNILFCMLVAAVFAPVWMLYFRLLGRLAWYCSGRYEQQLDSD